MDAARGVVVTLAGALVVLASVRLTAGWPARETVAAGALALAGAAVLGGTLAIFGGWQEKGRTFLLGVVCGLILLVVA